MYMICYFIMYCTVLAGVGPTAAFGLPGIFMMLATLLFWSGRRSYVNVPPRYSIIIIILLLLSLPLPLLLRLARYAAACQARPAIHNAHALLLRKVDIAALLSGVGH